VTIIRPPVRGHSSHCPTASAAVASHAFERAENPAIASGTGSWPRTASATPWIEPVQFGSRERSTWAGPRDQSIDAVCVRAGCSRVRQTISRSVPRAASEAMCHVTREYSSASNAGRDDQPTPSASRAFSTIVDPSTRARPLGACIALPGTSIDAGVRGGAARR
jgi:hypothetical protein